MKVNNRLCVQPQIWRSRNSFSNRRAVNLSLRVSVIRRVFALAFDPLLHDIFAGKCTTVFGAINMLSAFARVGASLCLLPLAKFAVRDRSGCQEEGRKEVERNEEEREEQRETKVGREDARRGKGTRKGKPKWIRGGRGPHRVEWGRRFFF